MQGLSLKLGVIAPTGEDRNQPLIGIAAPSVFQLGTGAWQVLLGAGYTTKSGDWTFSSQINVSLPLETSSQGFKPAESYFLSLGAGRAINDSLSFRLAVQGSYTTKDSYQGFILANTGATTISVRPSLIWQIRDNFSMSGSVNIPVYRDINETGIAAGPTFSVGFSKSF